jgi:predicted nucleic acid-binding protein
MIVVDTNLVASLFLEAETSRISEQVLARDPIWVVPHLWQSEFRNVLATGMRIGKIDLTFALEAIAAAEELLSENQYRVLSPPVLRLAQASGCSAYDCEFVVLAQELRVLLVTFDTQVLHSFPDTADSPGAFLSRTSA